jgi:hypothetical protein
MGDSSTFMGRLFTYGMSTMNPQSSNYNATGYSPAWVSYINQGGTAPNSGAGTVQTGSAGKPVTAANATPATATGTAKAAAGGGGNVTSNVTGTGSTLGGIAGQGVQQQRSLLG